MPTVEYAAIKSSLQAQGAQREPQLRDLNGKRILISKAIGREIQLKSGKSEKRAYLFVLVDGTMQEYRAPLPLVRMLGRHFTAHPDDQVAATVKINNKAVTIE